MIIILAVGVIAILNTSMEAEMKGVVEGFQAVVGMATYADEIDELKIVVDEFMELRKIRNTPEAQEFAEKIDQRLNSLDLVKNNCEKEISSLKLVHEKNPYQKIQELCPPLKDVSMSKAVDLWSRFGQ